MSILGGIGRHVRFLAAVAAGLAVLGVALAAGFAPSRSPLLAADVMFVTYIALTVPLLRLTPDGLRRRAEMEDAGTTLIFTSRCWRWGSASGRSSWR